MNNSELVSHIDQLLAASRFSQDRKVRLTELIGNRYSVCGEVYRVANTTGYVRRLGLRKGKTITIRLAGCATPLCIRCNYDRATTIIEGDATAEFSIEIVVTGYDDVRQHLRADELDIESPTSGGDTGISSNYTKTAQHTHSSTREELDQLLTSSTADLAGDQLLEDIRKMQTASQELLSKAADDITKAQSTNATLVERDIDNPDALQPTTENARDSVKAINELNNSERESPIQQQATRNFNTKHLLMPKKAAVDFQDEPKPTSQIPTEERISQLPPSKPLKKSKQGPSPLSNADGAGMDRTPSRLTGTQESDFDRLQRAMLGDQTDPIESKFFSELIALKTGVPVSQVRKIQTQLWHAVMDPALFGQHRPSYQFLPFGDFKILQNRGSINLEFKSVPVKQLSTHEPVDEYPYSNFDSSDDDSIHPPIATQAIRIASTVAPLVGLSPPITYDVIFETLMLLLKIFGVGKRRIRFSDVGEFFPVVLRGTLQYHFRPYRPFLRFATESFRSILSLAENEGEGQLAFEKDRGVPDRMKIERTSSSRSSGSPKSKIKMPRFWTIAIVGYIAYQLIRNFVS